jgi:hypothetical protein
MRKVMPDKIILVKNRPVYSAGEIHEVLLNKGTSSGSMQKQKYKFHEDKFSYFCRHY